MKKYIKLNNTNEHLSLGNFFNVIKKLSKNKSSAIQTELFCTLFNIENISDTTVGNYCTGYRAIGNEYKQIYLNIKKNYLKDKTNMLEIINNLISIIDGYIYTYSNIKDINNNSTLKSLCTSIHPYIKNDLYVPTDLKKELLNYLNNSNYYEFICNTIFFIILDKQQPLYEEDLVSSSIEEILTNTNMSINDLKRYLDIKFKEGISLIQSLKKLANNNNPYALNELGNLEYSGLIAGYPRYEEAYQYHLKAANYNHPTSTWMIAHMIINKKIGILSKDDINLAWKYLNKAISLNSVSAINTAGICYMEGITKDKKTDLNKAKSYFLKAIKKDYVYAYNNLGRIYEMNKDYQKALEYYLQSANNEESWACNKVGLYYFNGLGTPKNYQKAFEYFNIGSNSPINNRNPWNIYNLVYLFYLKGNASIGIKKDIDKAISLLNTINGFEPASELYLYCYYELYLINKNEKDLNKVKHYLNIINNTSNIKYKKQIEKEINNIYNYHINIKL